MSYMKISEEVLSKPYPKSKNKSYMNLTLSLNKSYLNREPNTKSE